MMEVEDSLSSLDEWVAVKKDIFTQETLPCDLNFSVSLDDQKKFVSISCTDAKETSANGTSTTYSCSLKLSEFSNVHQQLSLIHPNLEHLFPDLQQESSKLLSILFGDKRSPEKVCDEILRYLQIAVKCCGEKLLLAVLFQEGADPFDDYEENINEMKLKSYENSVGKTMNELKEVLNLRDQAETMLELATVYALEDEVVANISIALAELYNFQLHPFLELRELTYNEMAKAKDQLQEPKIGGKARDQIEQTMSDWQEQYMSATEALQQLYLEYYRRTVDMVTEQRDRMAQDQKNFGKSAFEVEALGRLQKLDVFVSQEKLKLLNAVKATREYHRDKIKQQIASLSTAGNVRREMALIEAEIYEAQLSVLDVRLDILLEEERLLKKQIAILEKEWEDENDAGVFYDAVEYVKEDEDVEVQGPHPKIRKLKTKLNCVFRKRAVVRNRKKALIAEQEKKKRDKESARLQYEKHHSAQLKRQERQKQEENAKEKMKTERRKALQRLRSHRQMKLDSQLLLSSVSGLDLDTSPLGSESSSQEGLSSGHIESCGTYKRRGLATSSETRSKHCGGSLKPVAVAAAGTDDGGLPLPPPPDTSDHELINQDLPLPPPPSSLAEGKLPKSGSSHVASDVPLLPPPPPPPPPPPRSWGRA